MWTAEWPSNVQCRGRNNAGCKPTKPPSLSNIMTCYFLLRTEANIYKAYPKSHLFGDTFLQCLLSNCLLPSLKGGVVCTYFPILLFLYWMSHHWREPAVVSFAHTCVIKKCTWRHISVGWWQIFCAVFIRQWYIKMTLVTTSLSFSWRVRDISRFEVCT